MCKRINRFFPLLILWYIGGSYLISYLSYGKNVPIWLSLVESQVLILAPVIVFILMEKINIFQSLPLRLMGPMDAFLALLFGYTLIPLVLFLNYISMFFSQNLIQQSTSSLMEYPFVLQIFFIAIIPGVFEEFIFRGVFYHSYRKNGILGAGLLSGFIFGIVHLNINQFVYAFVLGVIFAMLVEATGSLYSSMIAHFAINSYSVILLQLLPDSIKNNTDASSLVRSSSLGSSIAIIGVLGIFAISFGLVAFTIYKFLAKRNHRWNYMRGEIEKGLSPQNGERFITLPLAGTMVLCLGFMVFKECF